MVLLGTLDTKGAELGYLRSRLAEHGCSVIVVDAGTFSAGPDVPLADVPATEVASAAGTTLDEIRRGSHRGNAIEVMGTGARTVLQRLRAEGRLDGVLAVGGSGGAALGAAAMDGLPLGLPKLIVTTMAAGDTRPYIGLRDLMLLYPVVDIAGLNQVSRAVFDNAAAAMAAMAKLRRPTSGAEGSVLAATMFGVTTSGVSRMRQRLEELGHEVWTFHASGYGGRTMESLVADGRFRGIADITTTELADELVGGICSAGPRRMEAAVTAGLPQVVSTGALDMVNFGPFTSVPERFAKRCLLQHNANVTLMRTGPAECAELGKLLALKLNGTKAHVKVFVPSKGMSAVSVPGAPFFDPEADQAMIEALVSGVDNPLIDVEVVDCDINDPGLALAMANALDDLVKIT